MELIAVGGTLWVFSTAAVLVVGHLVFVVPARDRPHCLIPARFTVWGMTAGQGAMPLVGLLGWTSGKPPAAELVCGLGCLSWAAVGGVVGFVVGQAARAVMVRREE